MTSATEKLLKIMIRKKNIFTLQDVCSYVNLNYFKKNNNSKKQDYEVLLKKVFGVNDEVLEDFMEIINSDIGDIETNF
jgi:hypothetical protein